MSEGLFHPWKHFIGSTVRYNDEIVTISDGYIDAVGCILFEGTREDGSSEFNIPIQLITLLDAPTAAQEAIIKQCADGFDSGFD